MIGVATPARPHQNARLACTGVVEAAGCAASGVCESGSALVLNAKSAETAAARLDNMAANAAAKNVLGKPSLVPPVLSISDAQWGKKIGYHMSDFGLDVSNPAERARFKRFVESFANSYDQVLKGTFSGQGANGGRGDVLFYLKGKDVVVTSPSGNFVTILKNGINNPSVKASMK
ncbi:hypothetical protein CQ054_10605 [Ochrobactrum sp. MYb29]|nr:hypothetical protein CQ054_10605 [Ochrobactrum sp. MYb29]